MSDGRLAGVRIIDLTSHLDRRGSFTEVFCDHWDTGVAPTQWSMVSSDAGVFRGMHIHARHDELYTIVTGRATVGLVDIRPGSPTEGRGEFYELDGNHPVSLAFPRGLLHGLYFHQPTVHLQAVTESHLTYGLDDNNGCRWDDPDLPFSWPFETCVTSERHDGFAPLAELRARLGPLLDFNSVDVS